MNPLIRFFLHSVFCGAAFCHAAPAQTTQALPVAQPVANHDNNAAPTHDGKTLPVRPAAPVTIHTAYYPDYVPASEWAADLDAIRAAGLRGVRILEFAWAWYEPRPGVFDWEGLDRFLTMCQERNLEVVLSTPTATPPAWFWEMFPDARLLDADGKACRAHRHMTCWNHPGAREKAFQTISVLAARYGRHPIVKGWQIDNEPNYAEDYNGYYDFNPHALRHGQAWLRSRYGSIEALNQSWHNAFWSQTLTSFDQAWRIFDPRTNPQSQLDFCRWREHNMAEFVQDQAALLRKLTADQPIGVNIPECGVKGSVRLGQDYWAQARGLDWVGVDIYTATGDAKADQRAARYSGDLIRSVQLSAAPAGEYIVAETQGGPHQRVWPSSFAADAISPAFLEDMNADLAARGARQIWFFCWRATPAGAEMGMLGTQDVDGSDVGRSHALLSLSKRGELLAQAADLHDQKPLALLHYSRDAHRFLNQFPGALELAEKQMRGAHAALDASGYRVRFLNDDELEDEIPTASILVLAESPLLSDNAQTRIIAWSKQPGHQLQLGPHTGLLDRRGHWRARKNRPIWNHVAVVAGDWHDQRVDIQFESIGINAYRQLTCEPAMVEAWLKEGTPARIRIGNAITLHAWSWCAPMGEGRGSNPMPLR